MPPLLYLFCLVNLVVGTGAFIMGGILGPVAAGLGSTVPAVGQAMTAYALATAVLAPVLLVVTGAWSRKQVMLLAMALFAAGNVLCALAPSLPWLLAGRVVMGMGAVFTPVAAGLAVAAVPMARRGKALSLVFLGMSLSYVVGVPLGAWVAAHHDWHAPFWVVAALAMLMGLLLAALVPQAAPAPAASFAGVGAALRNPAVRRTLLLTLLYFTAIFTVFSYIGPVLQALVPMSTARLSITLAAFGLSGVAGTLLGGWANDRFGSLPTLRAHLAVLAAMMAAVPLCQGHYGAMLLVFIVWGVAGFGLMPAQQSMLTALAPPHAALLLSLNASMLYLGTALGAVVGGAATGLVGPARLAWAALPFALLAAWLLRPGPEHLRP